MFAGLVEEIGRVARLERNGGSVHLEVSARKVLEETKVGDSIAVNGVCLTITSLGSQGFSVDVVPETLRASTLGSLKAGDPVNLERALKVGDRVSGHQVLGHVDATGRVLSLRPEACAVLCRIEAPESVRKFLVPKGSVAVDGVSLTVAELGANWFEVSLIPHTRAVTTLGMRQEGDLVNLEADYLAKCVAQALFHFLRSEKAGGAGLTIEALERAGF
ncbi:MAG: riboflavin synthase [Bacillota bacterium]|nr:riboflavin synthase [Bacillota bacterium]